MQDSFAELRIRDGEELVWCNEGVQKMVLVGERVGKGGMCLGPSQVLKAMPEPDA